MKNIFVSFQSINNGNPVGMVKFLLPILEKLEIKLIGTYYVSSVRSAQSRITIKEVGLSYKILNRIIQIFYRKIFKNICYGKVRLLQEQLFDTFFSYRTTEPVTLISSAYLKKSTKKNANLGGINIFIAGNPDDREIYKTMLSEQNKYNVVIYDAYTYKNRIDFIENCLHSFDHIITFTISEYETYSKNIDSNQLSYKEAFIIPNKSSFENLKIQKNEILTFCYIAHTVWLKGLIYLVDAFSKIEGNNAQLLIGGTINKQVLQYIKSNGLESKNIKLVGHVSDLNKFLRTSHVCIVPSLLDAGPATVAEALYCGLPVITTEGCGSKTLIKDGKNGFIAPIASAAAIAEKIQWFIDNQDKIKEMSVRAKESIKAIENSDQNEVLANHIMEVIEKLKKEKSIL